MGFQLLAAFLRLDLPLRPNDVHRLGANLGDQLHLLQPVLFLLLVEDRADAAVGVLDVTAQAGHVLLLVGRVADFEGAVGDGRAGGAAGAVAVVVGHQHAAGHVADEFAAAIAADADADALLLALVVGLVVDTTPAQGAGAQAVLVGFGGAGDDAAVQLRVVAHVDLEAALAGVEAGLFLHAFVVGVVDLALARAEAGADDGGPGNQDCAEVATEMSYTLSLIWLQLKRKKPIL